MLAVALLGPHAPIHGQGQEEQEARFSEQVSVGYVLVPVVVQGPRGPVPDLGRDDFRLLVDGVEVAIESFESGEAPFNLFLLQDLSGSMELLGKLRSSRRVLNCLLGQASPADRFALHTFASRRVETAVELTAETSRLREAARSWKGYGTTALHDAIAWLPDLMVKSPSTRRAVLLISDGLDNASTLDAAEARHKVRASEVPVYVIGLETGSPYEVTQEGKKRYRYADVMNLLAHLTGGRYHSVFDQEGLDVACHSILEQLRHQYILGFSAAGGGEPKSHQIEIEVDRRNVEISHRRSYQGRSPVVAFQ
jgi:Ca-activated chloride channel family protein